MCGDRRDRFSESGSTDTVDDYVTMDGLRVVQPEFKVMGDGYNGGIDAISELENITDLYKTCGM